MITFIGEFGREELEYQDYLQREDLRKKVTSPERETLILGKTILTYDYSWLVKHEEESKKFYELKSLQAENPLQFFCPSGQGVDFLNDTSHTVKALIAPNRVGKTCTTVIDVLLDIVPCDPNWAIFKEHGVKWRPFRPPKDHFHVGMASYNWSSVQRTLWPEVRKWLPRHELGEYDPRLKGHKEIAWRYAPFIELSCGTKIYFFCYEQKQDAFESQALDRWFWDEQGEETKFDGGDERLRTRRGGRHVFALTPHKVEGRPDTGARSWIHRMVKGSNTKGHSISTYNISIPDVPDWVYPESSKITAYEKWVAIPQRTHNVKVEREGRARYFGEWHDAGGLVYDEWDELIHVVDDFPLPDSWTRYRAIDHGLTNPTACLCAAVDPDGDAYIYKEYYKSGLSVSENSRGIIQMSGNTFRSDGLSESKVAGLFFERIHEEFVAERYLTTVMDARSRMMPDGAIGMTLGELYRVNGLYTTPASGVKLEDGIPIVKEFLRVNSERIHKRNGTPGASRMYVFRSCQSFIREMRGYAMEEHSSSKTADNSNRKEKPRNKDDHLMDCLRYLCLIPLRHVPGKWAFRETFLEPEEDDKPFTGYFVDSITGY